MVTEFNEMSRRIPRIFCSKLWSVVIFYFKAHFAITCLECFRVLTGFSNICLGFCLSTMFSMLTQLMPGASQVALGKGHKTITQVTISTDTLVSMAYEISLFHVIQC